MRIIYMGTPDFAVEPLKRLIEANYNIVAVVTMPDKAIGRHHDTLQSSPVKQYAVSQGIPVLQPEKLKDPAFLEELRSYEADLQVVVAFRMLPEVVWGMPRLGTFNLHAALLPQYRGAAPINWAIINGETETGVTTFFLDHEIDTGRIILQEKCPLHDTDNAEDIHDRLMNLGSDLVVKTVSMIENGTAKSIPQEQFMTDAPLRHAPKIFKETCQINWQQPLKEIYNFIRGLAPYPASWTNLHMGDGKSLVLKIYACHKEEGTPDIPVGHLDTDGKRVLRVAVDGGWLHLDTIQLAGKKRMPVEDFLRGAHLGIGSYVD